MTESAPTLRVAIDWVATLADAPSTLFFVVAVLVCNEGDAEAVTRGWSPINISGNVKHSVC
jgi:hypothetical protein